MQACKQCLCNYLAFGVNLFDVPAFYIENAQKGLCKAKFANFACVSEEQYSMSEFNCLILYVYYILKHLAN